MIGPHANAKCRRYERGDIAKKYLQRFGRGYRARLDPPRRLIFVTALDDEHFRETAGLLGRYADIQRKSLFSSPLLWDVVVVLPTVEDYAALGAGKNVSGFYSPAQRALVCLDRGRVLIHEFTHALHHADQASAHQHHPLWIAEGFATLFECSRIQAEAVIPQVDQRLVTLQRAIEAKATIPLADLLKMDTEAFAKQWELAYAQSRYLMLYLYQQGKLPQWYKTYKALYDDDASGREALVRVLSMRLDRGGRTDPRRRYHRGVQRPVHPQHRLADRRHPRRRGRPYGDHQAHSQRTASDDSPDARRRLAAPGRQQKA